MMKEERELFDKVINCMNNDNLAYKDKRERLAKKIMEVFAEEAHSIRCNWLDDISVCAEKNEKLAQKNKDLQGSLRVLLDENYDLRTALKSELSQEKTMTFEEVFNKKGTEE